MFFINFNKLTKYKEKNNRLSVLCLISISCVFSFNVNATNALSNKQGLTFKQAINFAQKNDPWLVGNLHKQNSIELMSASVNTLPDPTVSLGVANLPTDGFDFGQEGMTQAKIGIAQKFPRGNTLSIKSQQLKIQSEAYPFLRKNREAQIAVTVGGLWLDSYKYQQSIVLVEKNKVLFEQLIDVVQAGYSSALGKSRQKDVISAQLALTRLEDRVEQLKQKKSEYDGQLQQWLTVLPSKDELNNSMSYSLYSSRLLSQELPKIELLNARFVNAINFQSSQELVTLFSKHPSVIALNKKELSSNTGITLAKQKFKPEWGVNASYGYRENDPLGNSRADLFSVGVTFDLPLFTANKQDKEVQSAIARKESVKTEKLLLLKKLIGAYSSAKGQLARVKSRQDLYNAQLIPQTLEQVELALSAYTNNDGNFTDVIYARIAVLNAEIDKLTINVNEQKINLELNYLFVNDTNISDGHHSYKSNNHSFNNKQRAASLGAK